MTRVRSRTRPPIDWLAATVVTALLGVGGGTLVRADETPPLASKTVDASLVHALGAPTGVLAVVNPVNCLLTAKDAAALNAIASVPGVRVTVLLLAVPARDSVMQRIRRDFGFAPNVAVAAAATLNPSQLPEMFRTTFVAVVSRGQLRHAAWGQSLKGIHEWLPNLIGVQASAAHQLSAPNAS